MEGSKIYVYYLAIAAEKVLSKFSNLKPKKNKLLSHTVSESQDSKNGLVGWFWLRVPYGVAGYTSTEPSILSAGVGNSFSKVVPVGLWVGGFSSSSHGSFPHAMEL